MTKVIDLPAGMEPGSPEALEHMLAQNPIHQGTLTTEPETPPVLPQPGSNTAQESLNTLILGLEMVVDSLKELRDNV